MWKHTRKSFLDSKVTVLKSHHTQTTYITEKVSFTEVITFCISKFQNTAKSKVLWKEAVLTWHGTSVHMMWQ
jgi:hypothetical protein